ncbi:MULTISPECIES: DEAD/DEAH box helicase [unclassified Mesorhizobium]|uniref:DEAD/DEAH box helicase n=1 Tax=Mesorhizobium sp. LSHC426A00 TaxID=1287298 RepID=UPI0012EBC0B2|nr:MULTISPECIES: DEAD/DEAH box helicase [unclassified Mesorhizobium]
MPLLTRDPETLFNRVIALSVEPVTGVFFGEMTPALSIFPGPSHLASLLLSATRALADTALANVLPPQGVNASRWSAMMRDIASRRPYLWRNHRDAIDAGYFEPGVSAVISFPTGAGKSTIAELKVAVALQRGLKVLFLAPTLALVDQTARSLAKTFPNAEVQRERAEETLFDFDDEALPSISVMTPERCLAMLSFDSEVFTDVGLLIFDECHLMHPRDTDRSRRAIDAMLCILNFTALVADADLLLLSAMMANGGEIAAWLQELTGRHCLSLALTWKPTRQVRGCVVYSKAEIVGLNTQLVQVRRTVSNINPPTSLKQTLTAKPFGFICLHQTWQSQARRDYALLPLLDSQVLLSTGTRRGNRSWYLTPNGNKVAATLAAATGKSGLKTLVFVQTIPLADSASVAVVEALGDANVRLTPEEKQQYDAAVDEMGSPAHVYVSVDAAGVLQASCACHHGLLLPAERHLHESLFKRPDGINVLVATSTLAQGMNLPSEVVIIGGDSRFDDTSNRMEQLEAYELLNAAGRAGRAGEASNGFVLVVPSKVVDFDDTTSAIHNHWTSLRAIFSQSDQCLEIDDPMTGLLDQIHDMAAPSPTARYFIKRLPVDASAGDAPARALIGRSFAAFRARTRGDAAWLETRLAAALRLRASDPEVPDILSWQDRLAASQAFRCRLFATLGNCWQEGLAMMQRLPSGASG